MNRKCLEALISVAALLFASPSIVAHGVPTTIGQHPIADASPQSAPVGVTIGAPLRAERAQEPKGAEFHTELGFKGRLIYAFDTATYGPGGFIGTWNSYLVLRQFNQAGKKDAGAPGISPVLYPVAAAKYDFLYDPQFSPNGELVLFKTGNPVDSFGTYQLSLWNRKTRQLHKGPNAQISHRLIFWSGDNRYLAYVQGAIQLPGSGGSIPGRLHIYDIQSGKDRLVSENEPILNSMAWTPQSALLFSQMPPRKPKPKQPAPPTKTDANPATTTTQPEEAGAETTSETESVWRPNVYQATAKGGESKLLIREGFRPAPAPGGKWIAFFGFSDPTQPVEPLSAQPAEQNAPGRKPQSFYLLLCDGNGNNRQLVRQETGGLSDLRWTPDGQRLLMIKRLFKGGSTVQVRIDQFDVATQKERAVATTEYITRPGTDISEDNPLFRALQVSNDGKHLFFSLLQFEKLPNNGLILKAVNLQSGAISTLCRIGTVRGLDWHDESKPIQANSKLKPK